MPRKTFPIERASGGRLLKHSSRQSITEMRKSLTGSTPDSFTQQLLMFPQYLWKPRRRKGEREREERRERERWRLRGCGPMTLTYFLLSFFFLPCPRHLSLLRLIGKLLVLYSLFLHFTCTYMYNDVSLRMQSMMSYISARGHILISNRRQA